MFATPQNQRVQAKLLNSYQNMIARDRRQEMGDPSVLSMPSSIRLGPEIGNVVDGSTRFYRLQFPQQSSRGGYRGSIIDNDKSYDLKAGMRSCCSDCAGGMKCGSGMSGGADNYGRIVGSGVGGFVVGGPINGSVYPNMASGTNSYNANKVGGRRDNEMSGGFLQFLAPLAMSALAPIAGKIGSKVADWVGLGKPDNMTGGSVATPDSTDEVAGSMRPLRIPKEDQEMEDLQGVRVVHRGGRKNRMVGRKKMEANADVGVKKGGQLPVVNTETAKSAPNRAVGGKKNWTAEERKAFAEKMRKAKEAKRGKTKAVDEPVKVEVKETVNKVEVKAPSKSGKKKVWTAEERKAFAEKMRKAKEAKRNK